MNKVEKSLAKIVDAIDVVLDDWYYTIHIIKANMLLSIVHGLVKLSEVIARMALAITYRIY